MDYETFEIEQLGTAHKVIPVVARYKLNNNLSITLMENEFEEFCSVSVNISPLPYYQAALDVPNASACGIDLVSFLETNGFGHVTDTVLSSGFNVDAYPVFEFDVDFLHEVCVYENKDKLAEKSTIKAAHIEVGKAPKLIDLTSDSNGSFLSSMQACVGGNVEYLDVLYGDKPALIVNEEGIFSCKPNRAIFATKGMEQRGFASQINYLEPVKEGELYCVLFGPILAVSSELIYDPVFDEPVETKRDINESEFEGLCRDFGDIDSGFKAVLAMKAS